MEKQLQRGLTSRHISMMAIGGTIGAGIFMGSADTLNLAGPGVVVAYLIAGFLLFHVMSSLAKMAQAYPGQDIRTMIHRAFGGKVSFMVGWLYLLLWVLVLAIEMVAAGTFLHYWFAHVPVWLLSLIVALCIILMNLASVRVFGEVEFWLSAIKVTALILFVGIGSWLILEQSSSAHSIVEKYTATGGFFPHGWSGITSAFLIVIFSFGGIELIGLTLSEVKDAQKALPKVLKGLIIRICFFYVLPILVICGLVPWNEVGAGQSPFVTVLSAVGLSQSAHIMNFIMLTAVISAANSGVYATSRMLYSLASDGEAPRLFTRLSGQGVPIYSLVASSFCLLIGACVAFIAPEHVFQILMSIPGFAVLVMWITICLAQLKLGKTNQIIAKSSPFWTVLTIIALGSILVSTMIDTKNIANTLLCVSVMIVLLICSYFVEKKKAGLPVEEQKIAS